MRYVASSGGRTVTIELAEDGHLRRVTLDDVELELEWQAVGEAAVRAAPGSAAGHYSLLIGGRSYDIYVRPVPQDETGAGGAAQVFEISLAGQPYVVRLEDERAQKLAGLTGGSREHGEAAVIAPMPGLVTNIMAEVGQAVERGQTVVVLEAMKMENDLGSPRAGVVRSILVGKGQAVNQSQVLAVIGDAEGARPAAEEDEEDEE
jgi:biotin carboxyl carrier protein